MDNDRDIKFDIVIGQPKFRLFSKWPPKLGGGKLILNPSQPVFALTLNAVCLAG